MEIELLVRIENIQISLQSDVIHTVQGVNPWNMQTLGLSSLCSNHPEHLTDSAVGPACLTGTA